MASRTPSQAESLRRSDSVLGVYQDTIYSLHFTRTPEFLGLWAGHTPLQLNQASQDVVVGLLDTRVWPESKSFDDSGMPDLPAKWKVECESGPDFKVCWKTGCFGSDILAGMDRAILDGVYVLSLSLGGGSAPYYRDTIAIGAFTATEKGIFVSWLAGKNGPGKGSLANMAPWIMMVRAGTIDRDFPAYAVMGDGKRFTGVSLYSGKGMGKKPVGLVFSTGKNSTSNLCLRGSLEPDVVRGKLVLCDRGINARVEKGLVVRDPGGVGMILANMAASGEELVADSHLLPAVAVGRKVGDLIRDYVRKDGATAVLSFGGTVLNVRPSPVVAAFSSRGPNMVTQQVLKLDVIEPGVNILAGWTEAVGATGLDQDTRKIQFNIKSGVWIEGAMGRQWDLICGLGEQESSLNTPFRSGIDLTVATFASAAPPVKRPSDGFENSIEVPSCGGSACGCSPSCDCKPECHC